MKYRSIINFLILISPNLFFIWIKPAFSSITILNCSGEIPNKTPCLIEANQYKINISRVDICQENPFPNYSITPDYVGSKCINLLDKKILKKYDLNKLEIPKGINIQGEYKYISLIFENKFLVSGQYESGGYFWKTSSKGPTKVISTKDQNGKAEVFTSRLRNWRGKDNTDNKYCSNNGGTFSRCDLNYNGYKLSAIGLGPDFIENYGNNARYMFFLSELSPRFILTKDSSKYLELKYKKKLEVYGDGKSIQSISIAPFIFETNLRNKTLNN
tara:strand:+ start:768 stop:1583 length:816 start_codon:yes stop_codon:yes gene_type:complete